MARESMSWEHAHLVGTKRACQVPEDALGEEALTISSDVVDIVAMYVKVEMRLQIG